MLSLKTEREFLTLAGHFLASRLVVMGGSVEDWTPHPKLTPVHQMEGAMLGEFDSKYAMKMIVEEARNAQD